MPILDEAKTDVVKTDVLVLGGGIAGCFAAIKAKESGLDVVMVDKGNVGRSGLSHQMSGVLTYFNPGKDDYDEWYREGLEVGEWINDQELFEGMISETTDRIRDLENWGVAFQKEGGEIIRKPSAGRMHTMNALMTNSGFQLMSVLKGEVLRHGVRMIERVMVTDLLTSDGELPTNGRIVGAVGFNIRTGKFYIFKSKATIIATGPTYIAFPTKFMPNLSGDGKAMAFRAGCEMRNVEFCSVSPHPAGLNCAPGMHILVGEGVHFVNSKGERFMQRYDPVRLERSTREAVTIAMITEEREGRGPIYWDARHFDESAYRRIGMAIPIVVESLAAVGLDFRKDKIPYTYHVTDLSSGGIRVNRERETTVPALYAAGAASDHGELGVATDTITPGMAAAIGGYHAGEAVAKDAAEIKEPTINERQVRLLKEEIFAPLKRESGLNHQEVREHCRSIGEQGLLGPIINESGLKAAIDAVQEIRENEIPKLVATDYHELARCIGMGNALLFFELLPRCALLRTERRGGHYRDDYPERDDAKWLKWVIAKKVNGKIKVWAEPIPFEAYPLNPGLAE